MSFQWMLVACCLYTEIGVLVILMLPIASPKRWRQLFRSRLFSLISANVTVYFYLIMSVMALLLIDAVREMRKYSSSTELGHAHIASELKGNVKLFRAQRNFYLTGFTIFLACVIRRFVNLIISHSDLLDHSQQIHSDLQKAARSLSEEVLTKEMTAREETEELHKLRHETEDLRKLHDTLVLHQQERNSMQQMIVEMTAEMTAMSAQIDMWKNKYEELSKQSRSASGIGDQ